MYYVLYNNALRHDDVAAALRAELSGDSAKLADRLAVRRRRRCSRLTVFVCSVPRCVCWCVEAEEEVQQV